MSESIWPSPGSWTLPMWILYLKRTKVEWMGKSVRYRRVISWSCTLVKLFIGKDRPPGTRYRAPEGDAACGEFFWRPCRPSPLLPSSGSSNPALHHIHTDLLGDMYFNTDAILYAPQKGIRAVDIVKAADKTSHTPVFVTFRHRGFCLN